MAKSSRFFLATMIGAVAGVIGGLLFAPQSGKKTREDLNKIAMKLIKEVQGTVKDTKEKVEEVFGNTSEEAINKYKEIKSSLMNKVAEVKTAGKEIDKEKYITIVEKVVDDFKSDLSTTKNGTIKLVAQLKKDWEKVKKALV
ncbi:MAG: YtxH domain-containing protein [Candidatus Shapirobacteria bacterium]|jgi:gas vesicle protein